MQGYLRTPLADRGSRSPGGAATVGSDGFGRWCPGDYSAGPGRQLPLLAHAPMALGGAYLAYCGAAGITAQAGPRGQLHSALIPSWYPPRAPIPLLPASPCSRWPSPEPVATLLPAQWNVFLD